MCQIPYWKVAWKEDLKKCVTPVSTFVPCREETECEPYNQLVILVVAVVLFYSITNMISPLLSPLLSRIPFHHIILNCYLYLSRHKHKLRLLTNLNIRAKSSVKPYRKTKTFFVLNQNSSVCTTLSFKPHPLPNDLLPVLTNDMEDKLRPCINRTGLESKFLDGIRNNLSTYPSQVTTSWISTL